MERGSTLFQKLYREKNNKGGLYFEGRKEGKCF